MATILDAWALMAYFEDEPAAPVVEQLLETAQISGEDLLLTAVNWGELFTVWRARVQSLPPRKRPA